MLFSLNGVIFFFYINCVIGEWLWDNSMMQIFMSCNCCVHVAQLKYTYSCGSTPFCHDNGGTSKGKVSLCPEFVFVLCCVSFCSFLLYRKKIKLGLVKVWLYVILKNGADLHNPMAFSVLPEPVCELAILFGSKILGVFFCQAALKWSCSLNLKIVITTDPCLTVYGIVKLRKHDLCFIYLKGEYRTTPHPN